MRPQLRTLLAVLICAAALTLAGCGSDDPEEDAGADLARVASDQAVPNEPTTDEQGWTAITDEPSGITFTMPESIEPQANTATVADGSSVSLRNYFAMTDGGIEVGVNVIDTPGEDYDFDAGIEGVAGSLGGEVVARSDGEVAGNQAVDVEMTFGEGYIVFFQLVTGEEHIVQALASGPESERAAVQRTYQELSDSVVH